MKVHLEKAATQTNFRKCVSSLFQAVRSPQRAPTRKNATAANAPDSRFNNYDAYLAAFRDNGWNWYNAGEDQYEVDVARNVPVFWPVASKALF